MRETPLAKTPAEEGADSRWARLAAASRRLLALYRIPAVVFALRTVLHFLEVLMYLVCICSLPTAMQLQTRGVPGFMFLREGFLYVLSLSDAVDKVYQDSKARVSRLVGTGKEDDSENNNRSRHPTNWARRWLREKVVAPTPRGKWYDELFDKLVLGLIVINTGTLMCDRWPMPQSEIFVLEIINFCLTALFTLEMVLKLVALGAFPYWLDAANALDGFIVLSSIAEMALSPPQFLSGEPTEAVAR